MAGTITPTAAATGALASDGATPADVFVAFGITGDLAKQMTFRSLYRLDERGLLRCPIVGVAVDDITVDELRARARAAIEAAGEKIDEAVFARFAGRLRYVQGDFGDAATYQRLAEAIRGSSKPVFYLEIPPFLFGIVVKGLAQAGLARNAHVVIEKPFGHDLASARKLAGEIHQYIDESQVYRIDHFLGKMGIEELLYLRFANSVLGAVWNREWIDSVQITMAESFGIEDRGHFYDPVGALRDVVVNHLMMAVAATAMEPPAAGNRGALKDAELATLRSVKTADPAHYVRGQYGGYQGTAGVAAGSATETYAALRLEIENERWSGVPFFIRAGKHLPVTHTEIRLIFKYPPRLGFGLVTDDALPEPDQLVIKLDPDTGVRFVVDARRAHSISPQAIALDMQFADEGGEGATPYEVLLAAAMADLGTRFPRQDAVEEEWRIMQPLLDAPPPVQPYVQGTWGPAAADQITAGHAAWHAPWVAAMT